MPSDKQRWNPESFPYETNYNDHFETSADAYRDVAVLLDHLLHQKTRASTVLYDPYFCQGRTVPLLNELGYEQVLHEKRDFYQDIQENQVPAHDVLITNPPYSDQHKERCLSYCCKQLQEQGRPFCLLLPSYVASRQYYRRMLPKEESVVYLVPKEPYEYEHPEGTGKAESPFASLWYCGMSHTDWKRFISFQCSRFRIARSLGELQSMGVVDEQRRPNPRQRRKRKKQQISATTKAVVKEKRGSVTSTVSSPQKAQKKSRYRDKNGTRLKKRF